MAKVTSGPRRPAQEFRPVAHPGVGCPYLPGRCVKPPAPSGTSYPRDRDRSATPPQRPGRWDRAAERRAGPAGRAVRHVMVDEAQELTDAEWQVLLLRCPARRFTVVGGRAQARYGFPESWADRLGRVGLDRITLASLTINNRTPEEVMSEAEPVVRAVLPDANVPTSIRRSGILVVHGSTSGVGSIVDGWL